MFQFECIEKKCGPTRVRFELMKVQKVENTDDNGKLKKNLENKKIVRGYVWGMASTDVSLWGGGVDKRGFVPAGAGT